MRDDQNRGLIKLNFRHIFTIIVVIAICEMLIMALLEWLPMPHNSLRALTDTLLLLTLVTPSLYLLVLKPMNSYMKQCDKAKEALYQSEEHYRAITDMGEALIWKIDAQAQCTFVNQTWLNFTGRTLEQQLGRGWAEEVHPDDRQACINDFLVAFEQHEKCSMKYRIWHHSGEYRWIQDNATPTFTSQGEFTGYIGHCLDIHEHKMAEEYNQKRAREYQTLFQYNPNPAIFWTLEGTIVFWNKAAEKTFGLTADEVTGQNVLNFFKPDYRKPEVNFNIEESLRTLGNEPLVKEYKRRDGRVIVCEWNRTPIYGVDGKIKKVISVAKDITEQKRFEAELIAAKEKAEESERLKSAFLANMSHELRSPLNSIIGFSELLSDPDYSTEQKEQFAQMINSGGRNLLKTITELMDYSRIDAGQMKVNKQPVWLNALLSDLRNEYSFKASEKGLDLVLDADNPAFDILVNTDEVKLRQVLVNMITNAIKFTAGGSIQLGLRATDSLVQLHVRDTGIGIPPEFQQKIFERFLQVEGRDNIKYGGIGLGLAISKSLVELLGGDIWVESRQDVGSTFYFTIPLEEQLPEKVKVPKNGRLNGEG